MFKCHSYRKLSMRAVNNRFLRHKICSFNFYLNTYNVTLNIYRYLDRLSSIIKLQITIMCCIVSLNYLIQKQFNSFKIQLVTG